MRFSRELWDGFDTVATHTERGIITAKEIAGFVRKFSKVEENYSNELGKLSKHGAGCKSTRFGEEYPTIHNWWMTLLGEIQFLQKKHAEMATKLANLPPGFEGFVSDREKSRKALIVDGQKSIKAMNDAGRKLIKSQQAFFKAHKENEAAAERYDVAVVEHKPQNEVTKLHNKKQKAATYRISAEKTYSTALETANRTQYEYYEKKMPFLMDALQAGDIEMHEATKKFIKNFIAEITPKRRYIREAIEAVDKSSTPLSPEKDLREFMLRHTNGGKPPDPIQYVDPADEVDPLYFGLTIDEIMSVQKKNGIKGSIPALVPALCDAIARLGGLKTEGIFRLSPDAGAVRQLRREIERGSFDVKSKDPNVPASLLKQWLRDLSDPIVPEKLYMPAVTAASQGKEATVNFLKKIPHVNRETLLFICKFLGNVDLDATKMSADNLAIVFGPTFLRCPYTDYEKQLAGAGLEGLFCRHIIETHSKNFGKDANTTSPPIPKRRTSNDGGNDSGDEADEKERSRHNTTRQRGNSKGRTGGRRPSEKGGGASRRNRGDRKASAAASKITNND